MEQEIRRDLPIDFRDEIVSITISADGRQVWINNSLQSVARFYATRTITIQDDRPGAEQRGGG